MRPLSRKSTKTGGRVVRRVMQDGSVKVYRYPTYQKPRKALGDTVGDLIAAWEGSPEWRALTETTKAGYVTYLRPLIGMERVRFKDITRRELIAIRNAIAVERGNGAATAFVRVASALFGWAIEAGMIDYSPMIKIKRLPGGHLPAWTAEDVDLALPALPEHLRRPVILALYTGQRRGDLIRMPWSAYDGFRITLVQEKTATPLIITVPQELRAELDAWRKQPSGKLILANKFGRPWQASNLSKQLGDALAKIADFPPHRNIHGLRKLAATNLAQAGCTLHEIAAITGHKSLAMIQLYTASVDQRRAAESAIVKLADHRKRGVR